MKQNNYQIEIVPVSKKPRYLKKFRHCLTEELLDSSVLLYYHDGKVIYSKLIFNAFNIPENVKFSAEFFTLFEHQEILNNFPAIKK